MSRFSYKSLILILLFLLIPIVLFLRISQKGEDVYANWWDETWMYRQSINVSSHNSDEANVFITATISIGSTAKTQADAGDFRFLNSTGQILPYYIVSGAGTTSITFHINLDYFPAGAQTLYAYYGNPSAENGFSDSDFSTQASNYTLGSQGTEEVGGGPIAYWKFDEGVGTTAYDSSSNLHHGSLAIGTSSPTWTTSEQCLNSNCLSFNGSTTYVDTNYNYHLNYNTSSTFSFWFKPNTNNTGGKIKNIIGKNSYEYIVGQIDSYLSFQQWNAAGTNLIALNTSNFIQPNTWYFINVIYDASNHQARLYINNDLNTSQTATNDEFVERAESLKIGRAYGWNGSTTPHFQGLIDEVKIYPYARSDAQIKADYATGLAGIGTNSDSSASFGTSSSKFLSDGLVGYWKFDEGVGTTSADSSGNNNLVTFATGDSAPSWVSGKYGIGTSFGGINYLDVGTTQNITNSITLTAWVKPTSGGVVIGKWASHGLVVGPNYIKWVIWGKDWNTYPTIPINQWSYITAIYDYNKQLRTVYVNGIGVGETETTGTLAINSNPYSIGKWSAQEFFQGSLDEIRVYNRALSPTEVKQLYEFAPGPMTHFPMDEKTGLVIYDKSGNNTIGNFNAGTSAPSWSTGKYGSGLEFNSTFATGVDFSNDTVMSRFKDQLTISTWYKIKTGGYILSKSGGAFLFTTSGNNVYARAYAGGGSNSCTSSGNELSDKNWHYLTMTYDDNHLTLFVDGVQKCTDNTYQGDLGSLTGAWRLGGRPALASTNGYLDDFKIYNYARTQKQILEDMNATSPVGGSTSKVAEPIAYYKFDEGFGSTTANWGIGGTALNGTLYGNPLPSWTNGKNNKSLNFVSSASNRVKIPVTSTNGLDIRGPISFSLWYKRNTANDYQTLVSLADSCGSVDADGNGLRFFNDTLYFSSYINDATAPNPFTLSYSNPNITGDTNNWHHVTVTWDGTTTTNGAKMYFDGKQTSQTTAVSDSSLMPSLNGAQLTIGSLICDAHLFNGLIDEVKIYNYALTADQIKQDYNQSSSAVFGSTSQTIGATTTSLEYCVPDDTTYCAPPVGEWKFDEGVGTTAFDSSGNNNGARFYSTTSWSTGKIGKGISLNGTTDYSSVTDPASGILDFDSNSFTISTWVKKGTLTGQRSIIQKLSGTAGVNPGWTIYQHSGNNLTFLVADGDGAGFYNTVATTPINDNNWHHITAVADKTNSKLYLYVDGALKNSATISDYASGSVSGSDNLTFGSGWGFMDGKIDQVRVYNYARTPAQIAYDYNRGEPVGWWKMDECQGTLINDWSGNANHGTLSVGASGTQNETGTCQSSSSSSAWYNGRSGKIGSSVNFDGVDDSINVGGTSFFNVDTRDFTIGFWAKSSTYITQVGLVSKGLYYTDRPGYTFTNISSPQKVYFITYDGTTQATLDTGVGPTYDWTHFTGIKRGGTVEVYVNGKFVNSKDAPPNSLNNDWNLHIGRGVSTTKRYSGQIDDVRIYNYALTPTQIKTLYNNGAVTFR